MIFCSKNEAGVAAWKLVLEGKKTVTRRIRPLQAGKIVAVQPSRKRKAVAKICVLSCIPESRWLRSLPRKGRERALGLEAKREGFHTWVGLRKWLDGHNKERKPLYRIEFIKVQAGRLKKAEIECAELAADLKEVRRIERDIKSGKEGLYRAKSINDIIPEGDKEGKYTGEFRRGLIRAKQDLAKGRVHSHAEIKRLGHRKSVYK